MQNLFINSLLKSARLAQEDPTASTEEVPTTSEEVLPPPEAGPSLSPVMVFAWLGAHLALGFLGWLAYDYNVAQTVDDAFKIAKA